MAGAMCAKRRSTSTFSDSNLTTLESLVLEVALEDAAKTTSVDGCEMDVEIYEELTYLPGNDHCADCESHGTEWASVSFGILLCATCSGIHRALGTHISRVRSIKMDSWPKEQVTLMRAGGNKKCQKYLAKHGGFAMSGTNVDNADDDGDIDIDIDIEAKYSSEAAQDYKELLKDCSTSRVLKPGPALDETESSFESAGPRFDASVARQETPTTIGSSDKSFMDDDDDGVLEQDLEGEIQMQDNSKKEVTSRKSLTLDGWFSKASAPRSSIFAGAASLSVSSTHHAPRSKRAYQRSMSSASSASAPTITYMGRSFSADGSDDAKFLSKRESIRRRKSDVKLLADLADQEEEIVQENAGRHAVPASHFSADKKVERFATDDSVKGGSSFHHNPFTSRSGSRGHTRHESMRQKLAYTDADLLQIAQNDQEFARLKAVLKSKGAVTNEMLKQKLFAFVANSKVRTSNNDDSYSRRNLKASKSEDMSLLRSHTVHTTTAKRR